MSNNRAKILRILALVLTLIMVMATLVSCAQKSDRIYPKSIDDSESYMMSGTAAVVAKEEVGTFSLESIKKSFQGTFVAEDRWKMIVDGLMVTLKMALWAALLGTVFGLLVYMLCRKGNKLLNGFFGGFSWLFSGMPMVVILMIFYYVIFGQSSFDGVMIAIIAFSLSVMLSVYSLMKTSVKAIDRGQIEGSYSLGFTDMQTFLHIVLPQAMEQFVPNYKTTLINMLKGTAIVGYIAVQDLTKVSDIIRSRTYDAFFPLIATAIIYLLIVVIMTRLIQRVEWKFQPKRRSDEKILKKYNK